MRSKNFVYKNFHSLLLSFIIAILILSFIIIDKLFYPKVELVIYSNKSEVIQIFWDNNGEGYNEKDSEVRVLDANYSERIDFPISNIQKLRIDFGDGASNIQVFEIKI